MESEMKGLWRTDKVLADGLALIEESDPEKAHLLYTMAMDRKKGRTFKAFLKSSLFILLAVFIVSTLIVLTVVNTAGVESTLYWYTSRVAAACLIIAGFFYSFGPLFSQD